MTSAAQLISEVMTDLERRHRLVTYNEETGMLYLNACKEPYEVPVRSIATHDDLLYWVRHLCPKTWVTTETIAGLIGHVYEIKGWEVTSAKSYLRREMNA